MDRRNPQESRQEPLHDPIHAAKAREQVERCQHPPRGRAGGVRKNDEGGASGLSGKKESRLERLQGAEESRNARQRFPPAVQETLRSMGILSGSAARLPEERGVVGNAGETERNAIAPNGSTRSMLGGATATDVTMVPAFECAPRV